MYTAPQVTPLEGCTILSIGTPPECFGYARDTSTPYVRERMHPSTDTYTCTSQHSTSLSVAHLLLVRRLLHLPTSRAM